MDLTREEFEQILDHKFAIHTADLKAFIITHVSVKIDELAISVKHGFDSVDQQFAYINHRTKQKRP